MLKMSTQLDKIISAYKTLSKIPAVAGGTLNNAGTRVTAKWTIRNVDKERMTKYITNYQLDDKLGVVSESEFGIDVSTELLTAVSPRETYRAVIREEKDAKDTKRQYLEVWRSNALAHCVDLTAVDLHGDVYADSEFGTLEWSPDETSIVYVAEKKLKKSEPYIKRKPAESAKTDAGGDTLPKKGEEYVYRQDWGEQLVGKHLSVIVQCKLPEETFKVYEGLPDSWCPGQIRVSPSGGVAGVAWETEPRRLGLIFCTNRPSYIFTLDEQGHYKKQSEAGAAVRAPRYVRGGAGAGQAAGLVWLQRAAGGPHHAAHKLMFKAPDSDETKTLIDIIQTETRTANNEPFYGLYNLSLPNRFQSVDGDRLVFSTQQQTEVRSYVLHIDDGKLWDISNKAFGGSTTILDISNDVILAVCSNLKTPGQLWSCRLPAAGAEAEVKWVRVSQPLETPPSRQDSVSEELHLEHKDSKDPVKKFTALYLGTGGSRKAPLVVWPHGGPHSAFVNSYSLEAAFFNMLGFACLQINYRGSVGAGQAGVEFLPSRVGEADVGDCRLATAAALERYQLDAGRVCLAGGSHGGFLVAHLSGQHPDVYKAVVARNPVIDVATMLGTTDIADWCAVEAGFEFTEAGAPSTDELVRLRACSPLVHVHRVRAPTALMLGSGDLRVPMSQGIDYSRRLKANGVPTRVYMYKDNHSLSSQTSEMDNLINAASWFFEHLDISE